jgi:hypothetical protein
LTNGFSQCGKLLSPHCELFADLDVGDGEYAEVVIEGRVYRVRIGELE